MSTEIILTAASIKRQSRQLGLILAAIFLFFAWRKASVIGAGIGGLLLLAGLVAPQLLNPLTRLWLKFGLLMAKVMNPIVLGVIWLLVFAPIALVRRLAGKDSMRRKLEPEAASYWIEKPAANYTLEEFKRQF